VTRSRRILSSLTPGRAFDDLALQLSYLIGDRSLEAPATHGTADLHEQLVRPEGLDDVAGGAVFEGVLRRLDVVRPGHDHDRGLMLTDPSLLEQRGSRFAAEVEIHKRDLWAVDLPQQPRLVRTRSLHDNVTGLVQDAFGERAHRRIVLNDQDGFTWHEPQRRLREGFVLTDRHIEEPAWYGCADHGALP